ncbi:MAG: ARPP-1 family domain-containing protein [Planctomycetota bacterium]|jgi:hypothetical protein
MISDEMRELLSTYVDGELRDADTARVEEMSKRDPELRREIDAYKILRRQLREWDDAENDVPVPPTLAQRALARVEAHVALRGTGPHPVVRLFSRPLAAAALLFISAGAGLLLGGGAEQPRIEVTASGTGVEFDVTEYPSYATAAERVRLRELPELVQAEPIAPLFEDGLRGWLVNGQVWTQNSMQFLRDWSAQRDQLHRINAKYMARPETRTTAANRDMLELVLGYRAEGVPYAGMVLFSHPQAVKPFKADGFPQGASVAFDNDDVPGRVRVSAESMNAKSKLWLLLAGEILRGEKDGSDRVRVVSGSSIVQTSSAVPVTWADRTGAPHKSSKLAVQPEMLGPEARRRLVTTEGRNDEFLAWLEKRYSRAVLKGEGRSGRNRLIKRLMAALRANTGSTGFAVAGPDGKVMGVELFATHAMLLEFAPRLLHGYLIEAGPKGISLEPATRGIDAAQKRAADVLDRVTNSALKIVDVESGTHRDEWAGRGIRRVNLVGARGSVVGHGVLLNGRPVQMTFFR